MGSVEKLANEVQRGVKEALPALRKSVVDKLALAVGARLKGNVLTDPGFGDEVTTGELAQGATERYLPNIRLFAQGVMTNLGILHEPGHAEPWIIAMDGRPTRAAVLDYGTLWGIEPMFSDFKNRGFALQDSQLQQANRLERLVLIEVI